GRTHLASIDLPQLTALNAIDVLSVPALRALRLPRLIEVSQILRIQDAPILDTLDLGSLVYAWDGLQIDGASSLVHLDLPKLFHAGENMAAHVGLEIDGTGIVDLSLPAFVSGSVIGISGNAALRTVSFPALGGCGGIVISVGAPDKGPQEQLTRVSA